MPHDLDAFQGRLYYPAGGELMWLLRQRQAQGSAAFPVNIEVVDEQTLLVTAAKPAEVDGDPPVPVVTRVIVIGGKVISMHQYRSDSPDAGSE